MRYSLPRDFDSQFAAPEPCYLFGTSDSAPYESTYSPHPAPTAETLAWRKSLADAWKKLETK